MYMSPEQCRSSRSATDRSDVYALGTLLFEMLAGRLPFIAKDPGEFIVMHMYEPAPSLASVMPGANPVLQALVDSMLDKNPERRPAMTDVLRTLRELSGTMGEQASLELDLRKTDGEAGRALSPSQLVEATAATLESEVVPKPDWLTKPGQTSAKGKGAETSSRDEVDSIASKRSQSSTSSPSLGERVLGRLRDTGRRSLARPREIGDELWSLLIRRGKKRRIATAILAGLVLVAGLLGPFYLGRSSVKLERQIGQSARPVPPAVPVPPPPIAAPPPVSPPSPPEPQLPADVRAALQLSEKLVRIGDVNEAMKGLRRALSKRSHPALWSTLGQLACRKDKLSVANQALAKLPSGRPDSDGPRRDLLTICKAYDVLENKTGKLVKLAGARSSSLRLRPVR